MNPTELREWDEIRISGTACSPSRRYENLRCTVATISDDGFVKVWPEEESPEDTGKIWFAIDGIESIELLARDD